MTTIGTLGLIGAGNMGSALISGALGNRLLEPEAVWVADVDAAKTAALAKDFCVNQAASNAELLEHADTIIIAVKPQGMADLLAEIAPSARADRHLFISIVAGIPSSVAEAALGEPVKRFIRVMPNTPAMLCHGASGVARGSAATDADMQKALTIFKAVGLAIQVDESQINAVTGLSGSGPAYIFRMAEAMTLAGEKAGLPIATAAALAHQTILGAAMMLSIPDADPVRLRQQVTSPGGTTAAGLKVLDDAGFLDIIERTVIRARDRGEELGKI